VYQNLDLIFFTDLLLTKIFRVPKANRSFRNRERVCSHLVVKIQGEITSEPDIVISNWNIIPKFCNLVTISRLQFDVWLRFSEVRQVECLSMQQRFDKHFSCHLQGKCIACLFETSKCAHFLTWIFLKEALQKNEIYCNKFIKIFLWIYVKKCDVIRQVICYGNRIYFNQKESAACGVKL
jgi:hypothetical protein